MPSGRRQSAPFPDKEQIRRFIAESPGRVGKREIARAFSISGDQRARLRELLRELREEGALDQRGGGAPSRRTLPHVCVLEVDHIDADGELRARPVAESEDVEYPTIYMSPEIRGHGALGVGDRVLARLERLDDGDSYQATAIRVLDSAGKHVVGLFAADGDGGRIQPAERRARSDYLVAREHRADAQPGELVLAELLPGRHLGLPRARVTERLGDMDAPHAISLLAIHANFIPTVFSDAARAEADAARPTHRFAGAPVGDHRRGGCA